ncbi:GNAT family N-acetyltransferase [Deinococcus altitudinis]|uniref:GNAT family N-acetyltransferase n=1 Tax=Deinococcus altitudinis TaxID=468914 RepID=UPI003892A429
MDAPDRGLSLPELGLPELTVEAASGPELEAAIPELSRLRVAVFWDFPYLYVGDPDYEARYLRSYLNTPESLVVLVRDGEKVVGASSALPLSAEQTELKAPWQAAGLNVNRVWYLAESVLLPEYRGRGLGVRFFEERERRGRELGYGVASFCAVERPPDHPRRPAGYVPLDGFWSRRGYVRRPELSAQLPWQDLDEDAESPKTMIFWTRQL